MHYYQHNIGDYARDTGHLTVLEHGIYRLLLDWCYLNEKPITTEQAIRVSRGNPKETQSVLSEFFLMENDGWIHKRVQKEVLAYHEKVNINRKNGAKGGRPKPNDNPVGSQSGSEINPNQEPLTNNHKPITNIKPIRANALDDGFNEFWNSYPIKTGKGAAEKSWKKEKPNIDLVLKALVWQQDSKKWLDGFIPNPSTYINQKRWLDEPPKERAAF
jgi:uncharacterized protein YdaU (DUF1376 family)